MIHNTTSWYDEEARKGNIMFVTAVGEDGVERIVGKKLNHHCLQCGEWVKLEDAHKFRNGFLCSAKCNNQMMGRLKYKREKKNSERHWRLWYHGSKGENRGWLHVGNYVFGFEIALLKSHTGISLDFGDGDHDYTFFIGVPGVALWLHLEVPWKSWLSSPVDDTEISLKIHNGAVWWSLWHSTMEWSNKTPRWRNGNFNFVDWLLGEHKHEEKVIMESTPIKIPMPEGVYDGTLKMIHQTWKRRWGWFRQERTSVEIEIPMGVPFSGKGENSYDCGDDATYSLSFSIDTKQYINLDSQIRHSINYFVKSIAETRRRYGLPSAKAFVDREMQILEH